MTAARFCKAPCMGSYIRDAAIRNRNRVSTSMLPCTSSTEPVSATDAIPSLSTMPAEDTNSAVVQLCHNRLLFHCPNFVRKGQTDTAAPHCWLSGPGGSRCTPECRPHRPFSPPWSWPARLILHPIAAHHDGNGYRDDPQSRQCHPPLKGKQAQGNEHGGDEGTEQAGDEVGAGPFPKPHSPP